MNHMPENFGRIVAEVRRQKKSGERPLPSTTLVDKSKMLTTETRRALLDKVASLVDENLAGRSEMCMQFADLLHRALENLKLPSRSVPGTAIYLDSKGEVIFRWTHAWVRAGEEVIDGNVDSLPENPAAPRGVRIPPYWGPILEVPADRRLREGQQTHPPADGDVVNTWWPDLRAWLDTELRPQKKEHWTTSETHNPPT